MFWFRYVLKLDAHISACKSNLSHDPVEAFCNLFSTPKPDLSSCVGKDAAELGTLAGILSR